MDKGIPVDAVYLDFQKAFDTVAHCRLLVKLQSYGINGDGLKWIEDGWMNGVLRLFQPLRLYQGQGKLGMGPEPLVE